MVDRTSHRTAIVLQRQECPLFVESGFGGCFGVTLRGTEKQPPNPLLAGTAVIALMPVTWFGSFRLIRAKFNLEVR